MHHKKNPSLQLATGRKVWVGMLTAGGVDTYVSTPHVIHVCVGMESPFSLLVTNQQFVFIHTFSLEVILLLLLLVLQCVADP